MTRLKKKNLTFYLDINNIIMQVCVCVCVCEQGDEIDKECEDVTDVPPQTVSPCKG